MEEQITQFLINIAPSIAGAITIIVAVVKMCKSFKNTSAEIRSDANVKELIKENQKLREENREIAQSVRQLTGEINRFKKDIYRARDMRK